MVVLQGMQNKTKRFQQIKLFLLLFLNPNSQILKHAYKMRKSLLA